MRVGIYDGHGNALEVASALVSDVGDEANEFCRPHQLLEDRPVRLLDDVCVRHVSPQHVHPKTYLREHKETLAVEVRERNR